MCLMESVGFFLFCKQTRMWILVKVGKNSSKKGKVAQKQLYNNKYAAAGSMQFQFNSKKTTDKNQWPVIIHASYPPAANFSKTTAHQLLHCANNQLPIMATSDQKTKPQKPQPPTIAKDNKNSHLVLYQTKITSKKSSLNNKK